MQEINIGQQIKQVFETKGISVTEFAKRINKSRENIYSIFSRKTIDTGLLLSISRVLDYDFFKLYSGSNYVLQEEVQKLQEENKLLKDYNKLLRDLKGKK
jgi:transcriptional regulator with XRE-family HTH domain